jgi:DMSO/TMAO reductase YedYZ molybdopterin-dependent catalytic subunit
VNKADRIKRTKISTDHLNNDKRLPPGQILTCRFPILHEGEIPTYDIKTWNLRVFGKVSKEISLTYEDILKMPQTKVVCDIHCVTRWSRFDNSFIGVKVSDFFKEIGVVTNSDYVMIHADHDYTANLNLADLMREDVILAHTFEDNPLTDKHGWPLRLIVPHLYFWKSVKWLRGFEFIDENKAGFWEENGFHLNGDPFKEERFSDEESIMPEDEWIKKEFD